MEELAISMSQQLRLYLADMPRQVQGEVDLMRSDMLASQGVVAAQGDLHLTAGAVDRIASTGETIKPLRRHAWHRRHGVDARGLNS